MGSLNLEAPRELPAGLKHLSHSSMNLLAQCPTRWYKRYVDLQYDPPNVAMTQGKAVGRTLALGLLDRIANGGVNHELLRDTYDSEWEEAAQEIEDWREDSPGQAKDAGAACVDVYALDIMPTTKPVTVEQGFELSLPDTDWNVVGFLDEVEEDGSIADIKVVGRVRSGIDTDPQAGLYIASENVQGHGLPKFSWHMLKKPSPGGRSPAEAIVQSTTRTQVQVGATLERIALAARELDWRFQTGNWGYAAPGSWLCGERTCAWWHSCPGGGLR